MLRTVSHTGHTDSNSHMGKRKERKRVHRKRGNEQKGSDSSDSEKNTKGQSNASDAIMAQRQISKIDEENDDDDDNFKAADADLEKNASTRNAAAEI